MTIIRLRRRKLSKDEILKRRDEDVIVGRLELLEENTQLLAHGSS
jgi:hypothetical protein